MFTDKTRSGRVHNLFYAADSTLATEQTCTITIFQDTIQSYEKAEEKPVNLEIFVVSTNFVSNITQYQGSKA